MSKDKMMSLAAKDAPDYQETSEQTGGILSKAYTSIGNSFQKYLQSVASSMSLSNYIDPQDASRFGMLGPSVFLYQLCFIGAFAAIFYTQYTATLSTQYLSPFSADQTGQTCKEVPISVSGTHRIDLNGIWEGHTGYDSTKAIYQVKFTNAQINPEEYKIAIEKAREKIQGRGITARNQDMSWSLLVYATFSYHYSFEKGDMDVYLTGDTSTIFGQSDGTTGLRASSIGAASSDGEVCLPPPHLGPLTVSIESRNDLVIDIPIVLKTSSSEDHMLLEEIIYCR